MTTSDLVVINSETQQATTSSLKVAEVFGKEHKDVLKRIQKLDCSEEFRERNFASSTYTVAGQKRSYPLCIITRDGFTFLAMGFTGKKAAEFKEKYIAAFNEMERQLKEQAQQTFQVPQNFADALQLAANQQKLLQEAQPKVEAFDALMDSTGLFTFTQVANALKIGSGQKLTKMLRDFLNSEALYTLEETSKRGESLYPQFWGKPQPMKQQAKKGHD